MEGSKGESVFSSMNLNPQLFINATLNTIDDVVSEAFDFYELEASKSLKNDAGFDRKSHQLSKGIDNVRGVIQSVLDDRLRMWEAYCVRHTFAVPQDFMLPPENDNVDNDENIQLRLNDQDLDAELDFLRHKLSLVGKRSVDLNSELQALERNSVSNEQSVRLVNEALKLNDESSVDDMSKEMTKVASELRAGIERLKTRRMNAVESAKVKRLKNNRKEFSATPSDGKLEELEEFLTELRKM